MTDRYIRLVFFSYSSTSTSSRYELNHIFVTTLVCTSPWTSLSMLTLNRRACKKCKPRLVSRLAPSSAQPLRGCVWGPPTCTMPQLIVVPCQLHDKRVAVEKRGLVQYLSSPQPLNGNLLGCADEDSAYLSKWMLVMLRIRTLDDAYVSTVVNTPKGKGKITETTLSQLSSP